MYTMTKRIKEAYMDTCKRWADLSYAKRLKVGCIIVKNDAIISHGYNGSPSGWDNCCERELPMWAGDNQVGTFLQTLPEVKHAEVNAIGKCAKHGHSTENAIIFCTHAPCVECAKLIETAGIAQVFFHEYYRDSSGIEYLEKCGIICEQL